MSAAPVQIVSELSSAGSGPGFAFPRSSHCVAMSCSSRTSAHNAQSLVHAVYDGINHVFVHEESL